MRRNLAALAGEFVGHDFSQLLAQCANLILQSVYLLLLPIHGSIERVQKILGQADLGLELVQSAVHYGRQGGGYICALDFRPGAAGGT